MAIRVYLHKLDSGKANAQTDGQTDRHTLRRTDRQTQRRMDRQTDICTGGRTQGKAI